MFSRLCELLQHAIVIGIVLMVVWTYVLLPSLQPPVPGPKPPKVDWSGVTQVWHAIAK